MAVEMKITEARKAMNSIGALLSAEEIVYVMRHGKRVFALVDHNYWESLVDTVEILSTPGVTELLERSADDIRHGCLIDHDDVAKDFGL